jgi:hypothetical protein
MISPPFKTTFTSGKGSCSVDEKDLAGKIFTILTNKSDIIKNRFTNVLLCQQKE